ncbi:hypothetical protein DUNSADRAFT_1878 [Dunaliella salina]|uniref:Encoded protein n=1 Tax=Dunaliella salina TaxID=3046 RepID=A0ABQ7FWX1_DUNSA|nr:hypothetical protein DUNSADRAFT_1878 [Dunaliella salina]|eukprot:KAF5826854.1 hypothetical protein DUNSADRAFT_1878 [Dunaliella salina]
MLNHIAACRKEGAPELLGGCVIAACASQAAAAWQTQEEEGGQTGSGQGSCSPRGSKLHIWREREVDIYGMSLSWQSRRVLMNIVCEQFA